VALHRVSIRRRGDNTTAAIRSKHVKVCPRLIHTLYLLVAEESTTTPSPLPKGVQGCPYGKPLLYEYGPKPSPIVCDLLKRNVQPQQCPEPYTCLENTNSTLAKLVRAMCASASTHISITEPRSMLHNSWRQQHIKREQQQLGSDFVRADNRACTVRCAHARTHLCTSILQATARTVG
jgi:hypothetical protein